MLVGGSGLLLCDSNDNSILETSKALRNQALAHPEAAELAALIHGMTWALGLGVQRIQFFCDDSIILDYVTRKAAPDESLVATLVEKVALLQTRFTSCEALAVVGRDMSSVTKLARDAIASQTRWREGDGTNTEDCFSSQLARGDTVLCPYPDCKEELVLEDCRGIVDDDAINLMIHRKKEKSIPVLDRVYCPKPSCNFLMSERDLLALMDPRDKSVARKCVECGLCFCKNCHVPWHDKKTCDEFKKSDAYLKSDAALFESLVMTEGWMKCPKCATVVQQNGGCNRITCRHCNHKFCYLCGAPCARKKMSCKCPPGN
ncbi:unnamed protein product [Microthlaspi erraticum]|uniref:RBR-type E3 ubiquitin transferase n=1 Tax=Microthlaspi erraticum TaxID=1685480 RepID=A0A6D2L321_9BRAS|nr:unnamed protein product [Microthlaspi erraticum]